MRACSCLGVCTLAPILAEGGYYSGKHAMFAQEILFLKAVRTGTLCASKLSLHRRAYCEEKKSTTHQRAANDCPSTSVGGPACNTGTQ